MSRDDELRGMVQAFADRLATDRSYDGDIVEDLRALLTRTEAAPVADDDFETWFARVFPENSMEANDGYAVARVARGMARAAWCAGISHADAHPHDASARDAEVRGWISDNDLLKLSDSVDDARNIRMSTKRTHLRVHPVYIPALAAMSAAAREGE